MGVDLTLFPVEWETEGTKFSHSRLSLNRCSDLWEEIRTKCKRVSFEKARGYFRDDYGTCTTNPYDEQLEFTTAGELSALKLHDGVDGCPINGPIWKYLEALEPETQIILYWH